MTCPIPELNDLVEVVYKAGAVLLEKWPNGNGKNKALNIEIKGDGSAVTEADFASNTLIVDALKKLYPNDGIISEELEIPNPRPSSVWIIDPLDGTQSFIDGKDDFSILVAKVINHQVESAIMYFPAQNITAVAKKGQGAFINGKKVKVSNNKVPREKSVYIRNLETNKEPWMYLERMDSGRALLAVATGEFDGAIIKMTKHKEWDIAAPTLVIEEAGGVVLDQNGEKINFNNDKLAVKYYLTANCNLIDFLETFVKSN
jgi:fructose-1,6-bisphosphatase/inositol monophosphatase family enzyme